MDLLVQVDTQDVVDIENDLSLPEKVGGSAWNKVAINKWSPSLPDLGGVPALSR